MRDILHSSRHHTKRMTSPPTLVVASLSVNRPWLVEMMATRGTQHFGSWFRLRVHTRKAGFEILRTLDRTLKVAAVFSVTVSVFPLVLSGS